MIFSRGNPSPNSRNDARHGYTLNEMLIVMALLVTLSAMAWPALRKPLARQQLRTAAKQLRAELAGTRLKAIEKGQTLQVRYLPGTGSYQVEPLNFNQTADGSAPNDRPLFESPSPRLGAMDDPLARDPLDEELDESDAQQTDELELPEEILFSSGEEDNVPSGSDLVEEFESLDSSDLLDEPEVFSQEDWSTPIVFYPNGRTSDAEIELVGDRDYRIRLTLRGVTGAISIGELKLPPKELDAEETLVERQAMTAGRPARRPAPSQASSPQDLWRGSIHGIQTNRAPRTP